MEFPIYLLRGNKIKTILFTILQSLQPVLEFFFYFTMYEGTMFCTYVYYATYYEILFTILPSYNFYYFSTILFLFTTCFGISCFACTYYNYYNYNTTTSFSTIEFLDFFLHLAMTGYLCFLIMYFR